MGWTSTYTKDINMECWTDEWIDEKKKKRKEKYIGRIPGTGKNKLRGEKKKTKLRFRKGKKVQRKESKIEREAGRKTNKKIKKERTNNMEKQRKNKNMRDEGQKKIEEGNLG